MEVSNLGRDAGSERTTQALEPVDTLDRARSRNSSVAEPERESDPESNPGPHPRPSAPDPDGEAAAARSHVWDQACSPAVSALVERYEAFWKTQPRDRRDPDRFLVQECHGDVAARLAVLRIDMALRWEAGDTAETEWYRDRFPDLGHEELVALAYEEFCLREESGQPVDPRTLYERFPEQREALARVLGIHELVGPMTSTVLHPSSSALRDTQFPDVGETIAGFRLVELLGEGAFARVFLGHERQLADRQVALKVTRRESREPQTLARLQHTHIVPVYSYQVDPATGLHLLCMPYFGRVTLARLLADPAMENARHGADILAILDRIEPDRPAGPKPSAATERDTFSRLPFAEALALWALRLAEALAHAHDRGVLHRDIKPSNVLITADGLPMLLDFNLAGWRVSELEPASPDCLGGTFPYMAPEHLVALAEGSHKEVDARTDIFSLGVVLYEAMGVRPFPVSPARTSRSLTGTLRDAAAERSRPVPPIRQTFPEVPAAFEAVVLKCLAPNPADRYPSAHALAADLQAVVTNRPLHGANEPWPSRGHRWFLRNRRRLAVLAPAAFAIASVLSFWLEGRIERTRVQIQVEGYVKKADEDQRDGKFALAERNFKLARDLSEKRPELRDLYEKARGGYHFARIATELQGHAEEFYKASGSMRFTLLGFGGDADEAVRDLAKHLRRFGAVIDVGSQARRIAGAAPRLTSDLSLLLPEERAQLRREVQELCFFGAVSQAANASRSLESARRERSLTAVDPQDAAQGVTENTDAASAAAEREARRQRYATAIDLCDVALGIVEDTVEGPAAAEQLAPWLALKQACRQSLERGTAIVEAPPDPESVGSAWACFQWGLMQWLLPLRSARDLRWLERSVQLDPSRFWSQYYLGYEADRQGLTARASNHYHAAIALEPGRPVSLFTRARLLERSGGWALARQDLDRAIKIVEQLEIDFPGPLFERGFLAQRLGDFLAAWADYRALDRKSAGRPPTSLDRTIQLNRALIDLERGRYAEARRSYNELLPTADSDDERRTIRYGEAMLAQRQGDLELAAERFAGLLEDDSDNVWYHLLRSWLLFRDGRSSAALHDAERAYELDPRPETARLMLRVRLARGDVKTLDLFDPDEIWRLPGDRLRLAQDLRRTADQLRSDRPKAPEGLATVGLLLASLGDREGLDWIDRAKNAQPHSPRLDRLRALVRQRFGDREGALSDADNAIREAPFEAAGYEVRASIALAQGRLDAALADLARADHLGGTPMLHGLRARLLRAQGSPGSALTEQIAQVAADPLNPLVFIERAELLRQSAQTDQALADLETAARLSESRVWLYPRIAAMNIACQPTSPGRWFRAWTLIHWFEQRVAQDLSQGLFRALRRPAR
jgi:serine/threonine protein kinase/tetratricopeptide (TPR) repeat protein